MKKLLFLLIPVILLSCSAEKKAQKAYENGKYQEVIDRYSKLAKKEPANPENYYYIAKSYLLSNRPQESVPYYEEAINKGMRGDTILLAYSYALKTVGNYEMSRKQLEHLTNKSNDDKILALANDALLDLNRLENLKEKQSYFRVKNLEEINTDAAEYSPVYNDGFLYFTSNRTSNKIYEATGTPFTDIYRVKTQGANVDTLSVEALDKKLINDPIINEGSVTFTPDGRTMIYAKGNSGKKKGTADVNLYITRYRNGEWSEPRMLNINHPGYWDSSPAFSRNGRTLYFASNRPGGLGGTDIYQATMDARGRFRDVRNLGSEINTPGNEMFPYISDDGHMYFSSDGHPGFGALDIFVAKRVNGQTSIENMGEPVNSNADDFGIYMFKADRGFFTSNRAEGKGDDDIYTFVNQDPDLKIVNYFLEGITMTKEDNGDLTVLPRVQVKLLDYKDEVLDETITEEDGKFRFRVYEHENYRLVGEKMGDTENYFVTRVPFTTVGRAADRDTLTQLVTDISYDTLVVLEKIEKNKVFVLENIYYDFNKYDIRPDAAQELDKLVTILEDNPHIKIELSSHTDSVDTERYNQMLSQKRAESAVEYIVDQGIDKSRLIAKGYGESFPIAPNTNPDGTDNPEGRAKNRRTEFKIIDVAARPDKGFNEDKYFDDEEGGD
ncbi:MAG: OmpA family protein [Candidatus Cyclobacteriaceae bacterium M2_1C_046]